MGIESQKPIFWVIHLVVTAVLLAAGLRWRRFWSVRFLIAGAILNIALLYAPLAIFYRGNGINAPGTPDWVTASVYAMLPYHSSLVLCLGALGLLSFLPGGEPRGRPSHKLLIRTAALCLVGLVAYRGFRTHYPPAPRKPLDPLDFYPEKPVSSDLQVRLQPKQEVLREGTGTQFEVTFTNTSTRDINLAGVPYDGLRFRPYIYLQQMRGGVNLSWGTGLKIPPDHEVLRAGESWTFNFPQERPPSPQIGYDENRQVLSHGEYAAFLSFWIEKNGQSERVLSNAVQFTVHK